MSESLITRGLRRVRARLAPGGVILNYHRIADPVDDPTGCAVSPMHFQQHLDVIATLGVPATLDHLVDAVVGGHRPERQVVVTIDDGYRCGLTVAVPIMQSYAVPATFFVPVEPLRSGGGFYWDRLFSLLAHDEPLPQSLELRFGTETLEWRVAPHSPEVAPNAETGGLIEILDRRRLSAELSARFHPLLPGERNELLEQVAEWSGREVDEKALPQTLDADELVALADSPLCTVGAHTVSHTMLSAHPASVVARELGEGRRILEEMLGQEVLNVAYPFGDYSAAVRDAAAGAGFRAGCTLVPEGVLGNADQLALPRFLVRDCDGESLARTLHWLGIG